MLAYRLRVLASLLTLIGRPFFFLLATFFLLFYLICKGTGRLALFIFEQTFRAIFIPMEQTLFILFTSAWEMLSQLTKPKLPTLPRFQLHLSRKTKLILLATSFFCVVLFLALASWFFFLKTLPKPGELITRPQPLTTKIYDRKGNLLYKVYRQQNRTLVKLDQIPIFLKQATVAIEDKEFYSHPGFSIKGMLRAAFRNITRGQTSGGSTITQQLVKNALLTPEKSILRKIREIILAVQVEMVFTKDEILEMYLNEVAYGGATYGVEEASQLYFGKKAKDLNLAETTLLAGLPKAPTTYSPFGANPSLSRGRQLEVLGRMVQDGYLTEKEAEQTSRTPLVFAAQKGDIKAPHFVMFIKELLAEKYGERLVEEGGLNVITSLDLEVQEMAEKAVKEEVNKIRGLRVSNGATLVSYAATGEVLAMVGSKDYFDKGIDGNFNVTTAARQPGSAIKPVNYSRALELGRYTAATILSDTPITYQILGSPPYSPRNYDSSFHGKIPLRVAVGSSYNVPAVKVLASYGVEAMIEQGRRLGITTWIEPKNYGLSLTLGGGEVKMLDMVTVYGSLANYGKKVPLRPILQVADSKGRALEVDICKPRGRLAFFGAAWAAEAQFDSECGEQVLDPRVAFILTDILHDNWARTPAFGPNSLLNIPGHPEVAVKTGTTQNLRDNWAIGYTKDYVVAAWVGNNDNTPMAYVASGVTGATPIWNKIMSYLLAGKPNHSWEKPEGIVEVSICPFTGTLPCEGCPAKTEYFLEGTQPTQACNLKEEIEKKKEERSREGEVLSNEDALEILINQY